MVSNGIAAQRDVLQFQPGATYQIKLKYTTGKAISNGRIMFSTTDDEVFFLDQQDADKIYDLQLRPQEAFRLLKQSRNGPIAVERISGVERQVIQAPAAPATTESIRRTEQPPVQSNNLSGIMASSYGEVSYAEVMSKPIQQQQANGNNLSGIMASSYISAIDALVVAKDYAESHGVPFRLSTGEIRAAAHCIFIAVTKNGGAR